MADNTQAEPTDVATFQPSEQNSLTVNADVLRIMMERAWLQPRDIEKVQNAVNKELEIVPGLAARAYYSIPYNQRGEKVMVEGPSIKAAMTLCRNWGNAFNDGRVVDEDKSNYYVNGIFFDLESNLTTIRQIKVSKFFKPKGGQGVVPRNADMMYLAVQAGISKAVRNAILASLPDWLVNGYFNKAKELVVHPPEKLGKPAESIQVRIEKGKAVICKEFKVTPEEMEAYLMDNADGYEDEASLLTHLQGLYNGMKDGQINADQVFRAKASDNPGMPQAK